jgi:hypothetical protein
LNWNLKTVSDILLDLELEGHEEYLIDGMVRSDATTIVGDPYVGKTHFAIDIARSLTTSEKLLGREVIKPVDRVAFLCTDPGGKIEIARRVQRAGLDTQRIVAEQFYPPREWKDWQDAVDMFRRDHIGLIVIDNTTDLADDANDPRHVKAITDGLRLWSDSGATILNLHHQNKGFAGRGKTMFGSILWSKWTRMELRLTKSGGEDRRRLVSTSNGAKPLDLSLRFTPEGSPAYSLIAEGDSGARRDAQRSKETLDKNQKIKVYLETYRPNGDGWSFQKLDNESQKILGFRVSKSHLQRVEQMEFSAE